LTGRYSTVMQRDCSVKVNLAMASVTVGNIVCARLQVQNMHHAQTLAHM
jgi:hypothetical protein